MLYIAILILFGLLFMVVEVLLLPGVSIGGLLAMVCYGSAIYIAYRDHGFWAAVLTLVVILLIASISLILSLRSRTWQRFSLKQKLEEAQADAPQTQLHKGQIATTLSRLAPMGKIEIEGRLYEAKSASTYIDPQEQVEIVGFENMSVIVKPVQKQ